MCMVIDVVTAKERLLIYFRSIRQETTQRLIKVPDVSRSSKNLNISDILKLYTVKVLRKCMACYFPGP